MTWDCSIADEIGQIFDAYSWRVDDYETALERRAAIRAASLREGSRRYRKIVKPWLKPHNKIKNREYKQRQRAQWTDEQKKRVAEQKREWKARNRQRVVEASRRWRERNREAEAKRVREWREANKERVRQLNLIAVKKYRERKKARSA